MLKDKIQIAGKRNIYLLKSHYDALRDFILDELIPGNSVTLDELLEKAKAKFFPLLQHEVGWHLLMVKFDLQTRGVIKLSHDHNRRQLIKLKRNYTKLLIL